MYPRKIWAIGSIIFLYFKCNVVSSTTVSKMTDIFNIYPYDITQKKVREYEPHFTADKVWQPN